MCGFFMGGLKTCLRRPCFASAASPSAPWLGMEEALDFIDSSALTASNSVRPLPPFPSHFFSAAGETVTPDVCKDTLCLGLCCRALKFNFWVSRGFMMVTGAAFKADADRFLVILDTGCRDG
jgi:hypothetical protein